MINQQLNVNLCTSYLLGNFCLIVDPSTQSSSFTAMGEQDLSCKWPGEEVAFPVEKQKDSIWEKRHLG